MNKSKILNHEQIQQKIIRIAYQIVENNIDEESLYFVGVEPRGSILCDRLATEVNKINSAKIESGTIKLDKDHPLEKDVQCSLDLTETKNKTIILIDDVLNTGKALIYAANHLLQSEPKSIQTVTLIDRRHRLFPIRADYVGLTLATTLQEHISVEFGDEDIAWLK